MMNERQQVEKKLAELKDREHCNFLVGGTDRVNVQRYGDSYLVRPGGFAHSIDSVYDNVEETAKELFRQGSGRAVPEKSNESFCIKNVPPEKISLLKQHNNLAFVIKTQGKNFNILCNKNNAGKIREILESPMPDQALGQRKRQLDKQMTR